VELPNEGRDPKGTREDVHIGSKARLCDVLHHPHAHHLVEALVLVELAVVHDSNSDAISEAGGGRSLTDRRRLHLGVRKSSQAST